MPGKKTAPLTKEGIESLAQNKPVVYKVLDPRGALLYAGVAKRGRVEDRLKEHLPTGPDHIPRGRKVTIQQKSTIDEALKSEARIIKKASPPLNKNGK